MRYSALFRVKVGTKNKTFTLSTDYDTKKQAREAALKKWGPLAESRIRVFSFTT